MRRRTLAARLGFSAPAADNGVAARPAGEILAASVAALKAATSFRMTSRAVANGETDVQTASLAVAGTGSYSRFATGSRKATLVTTGGRRYLKADAEYWQTLGLPPAGRWWVEIPNSYGDLFAPFDPFDADAVLRPDGTPSTGEPTTIAGTPAIAVVDSVYRDVLYVATAGPPYPLRITGRTVRTDRLIEFRDFGRPFPEIKAPAAEKVLKIGHSR